MFYLHLSLKHVSKHSTNFIYYKPCLTFPRRESNASEGHFNKGENDCSLELRECRVVLEENHMQYCVLGTIGCTVCLVFLWMMNDVLLRGNKTYGTDAITAHRKLAKSS